MESTAPIIVIVAAAVLAFVAGSLLARRRGYHQAREVVARCRRGHLFTTVWGARLSRQRFDMGWARIQRCPVGDHLTLVVAVKDADLTPEQRKQARKYRDGATG